MTRSCSLSLRAEDQSGGSYRHPSPLLSSNSCDEFLAPGKRGGAIATSKSRGDRPVRRSGHGKSAVLSESTALNWRQSEGGRRPLSVVLFGYASVLHGRFDPMMPSVGDSRHL